MTRLVLTGISKYFSEGDNRRSIKRMAGTVTALVDLVKSDRESGQEPKFLRSLQKIMWLSLSTVDLSAEELEMLRASMDEITGDLSHQVSADLLRLAHIIKGTLCQYQGPLRESNPPKGLDCPDATYNLHLSDPYLREIQAVLTTGRVRTGPQTWFVSQFTDHEVDDPVTIGERLRELLERHAYKLRPSRQDVASLTTYLPRPFNEGSRNRDWLTESQREVDKCVAETRSSDADLEAHGGPDMTLAKNSNGQNAMTLGWYDQAPPCDGCGYPKRD